MLGNLYVITNNVNNKQYVGKTYKSVSERFKQHKTDAAINNTRPICRAITKYGYSNFSVEHIGSYKEGILEQKEIELIAKLDTYNNGYNATLGGDGSKYLDINEQKVIEKYKELQNITYTAEFFDVSSRTISRILKYYNVDINKRAGEIRTKVLINELDLVFESLYDCAKLLIEAEVTPNTSQKNVASNIGSVLAGRSKSYLGFTYTSV